MRNTLILLLILALCAGVFFLVKRKGGKSLSEASDFSVPDTAAITSIHITRYVKNDKQESIRLERKSSGAWTVNEKFDVQPGKINALLQVIHSLEVKEKLSEAGINSVMEIMKRTHSLVEISGKEGEIKTYLIGPTNQAQTGNVMLLRGEETPFVMARPGTRQGYLYIYYSPEIDDWRDNILFDADSSNLLSVQVKYPGADSSFQLSRKDISSAWVADFSGADESKIKEYVSAFTGKVRGESFAGLKYPGTLDSLRRKPEDLSLRILTSDGKEKHLRLYRREDNPENFFGWIEGQNELLTIQYFVIGKFLAKRQFFSPRPI